MAPTLGVGLVLVGLMRSSAPRPAATSGYVLVLVTNELVPNCNPTRSVSFICRVPVKQRK